MTQPGGDSRRTARSKQWRAPGGRAAAGTVTLLVISGLSVSGCAIDTGPSRSTDGPPIVSGARIGTPVTGDAGEWTMPARDFAGSRYSTLSEITSENVSRLKVAWTFSTGVLHGHEGGPLVIELFDVRGDALPQHCVRIRSVQAGRAAAVEVPSRERSEGGRCGVLRCREPRGLL